MGHKDSGRNFPEAFDRQRRRGNESRYNSRGYYEANRELGKSRDSEYLRRDDDDAYDDFNTGKQENYNADGYYGSNYGSISESNRGRDYEGNAGYRYNYDHLPTGQWPEIDSAAERRGVGVHQRSLEEHGFHRGKGPRGYERSDQRLEEDINDLLTEDPYIDASEIEVKVEKGNVVLTGVVENRHIKRRVEDLAENVRGIKNVENRLRSSFPGGQTVNIRNSTSS